MTRLCLALLFILTASCSSNSNKTPKETSSPNIYSEIDSIQKSITEGKILPKDMIVVDSNGDSIEFGEILNESTIYVRFSSYGCKDCIDFVLDRLTKSCKKFVILVSEMPVREMYINERSNPKIKMYKVSKMGIDFDEGLTPVLFKEENLRVKDFFIPHRESAEYLEEYLSK